MTKDKEKIFTATQIKDISKIQEITIRNAFNMNMELLKKSVAE